MEQHYKYLHSNPELSGVEYNTNLYITKVLLNSSAKIIYNNLSIIAFFDKGKKDTIALRSELDALPIIESKKHLIRSENSNMHACGHDVHSSALLTLIPYIENTSFSSNICLIFQSKEESGLGAKDLVNTTIFNDLNIVKIIAMHVWPNLENGVVFSNEKLMFGSYELDVFINGENNHVSSYNKDTDATYASYLLYKKLFKNTKKYINHLGCITSGNLRNISSNLAVLNYSIRFKKDDKIVEKITNKKVKTKCIIDYEFNNYFPVLNNDKELLKLVNYTKIKTLKSAEDFGYYSSKCKILYLLYGLGKGKSLHTSEFIVTKEQRGNYYITLKNTLDIFRMKEG